MLKLSLVLAASIFTASFAFATDCKTLTAHAQESYNLVLNESSIVLDGLAGEISPTVCAASRKFVNTDYSAFTKQVSTLKAEMESLKLACPQARISDEDSEMTIDQTIADLNEGSLMIDLTLGVIQRTITDCEEAGL